MKAMLLAAGRGERLRPLTDRVPKPLVQAGGKPLIGWHLERLAAAGCRDIVVNVSHLGDRIIEAIGDGARYGMRLSYSQERERLETAGGIANALPLLGREPLEVPGDERLAAGLDQRFRDRVGERPQPLAAAGGQEHRLHARSSSSRSRGLRAA